MFFRLLKLAGVDVNAKIAELKADLEFKIGQTSEEVTRRARTMGLVAGLFLSAGILALMVLIVILIAIYKWGELNYGAFVGLELVAGVLIILTAILVVAALSIAKQPSKIYARRSRGLDRRYLLCSAVICAGRKPVISRSTIYYRRSGPGLREPLTRP